MRVRRARAHERHPTPRSRAPSPRSYPRAAWLEQTIVLDDLGTLLQPPYALENVELGKDKSDTYKEYLRRKLENSRALALAA